MRMPWIYRMALTIFMLALPLFIYIGFRLSAAISKVTKTSRFPVSKTVARLAVFTLILWAYLWPATLLISRLTGSVADLFIFKHSLQWQDYLMVFPAWIGMIAVIEMTPYFVVLDIIGLVGWIKKRKKNKQGTLETTGTELEMTEALKQKPEKPKEATTQETGTTYQHEHTEPQPSVQKQFKPGWRSANPGWIPFAKIAVALFFVVYVGIKTYVDTNHVNIDTATVAIENLPKELDGLRLCFFGDIHINRNTDGENPTAIRESLQSGDDDLVFFSGDLISSGTHHLERAFKMVSAPRAKIRSIACMGDHDYWTAPDRIVNRLKASGWEFLQNQHHLIHHKGKRILVTGLTYVYSSRISDSDLKQLLENAPQADLKIMMVHQPREHLVEAAAKYGYHLFLAGHTHGGEVVNHVFGYPVSPAKQETRYAWGQHRYKGMQVIITNGVGRTLAALRYHAPAEITRLILSR